MVRILEGFLLDLFDSATKLAEIPAGANRGLIDQLLDPMDAKDLYDMVVKRLHTVKGNSNVIQPYIMPLFFPETKKELKEAYKKLRNNYPKMSEDMNPDLYDDYKYKLENAIIEFCTVDALDIIKRVQYAYKQKDKNVNVYKIPAKVYVGTIIKEIYSGNYDMTTKMASIYKEYVKEAQKSSWQYKKPQDSDQISLKSKNRQRARIEDKAFELVKKSGVVNSRDYDKVRDLISHTMGNSPEEIAEIIIKYYHNNRGDK